ncbi:hypothetical protein FRC15_004064, partial [Serendipita sp. 397]
MSLMGDPGAKELTMDNDRAELLSLRGAGSESVKGRAREDEQVEESGVVVQWVIAISALVSGTVEYQLCNKQTDRLGPNLLPPRQHGTTAQTTDLAMSSSTEDEDKGLLYLHHVTVETPIKSGYRVKLNIDHSDIQLAWNARTSMWKSQRSLEVAESSKVQVTLKTGRTIATISFGKDKSVVNFDAQDVVQQFLLSMQPEILVSKKTMFRQHPATITVSFRPPPTSESIRSTLYSLQESIREFRHIMGDTTQKNLDTIIKCGVAFSELDPRSKVAFRVLTITFELLKQQKGRDQMVSDLTRQLKRILPFAKEALKEAIEENADILQKAIGRLYTLTTDVAEFSCDYVKRNRFNRLMKSVISNEDQDQINEFTSGFKELVEDFDRAVNVEMFKTVRSMEEKMLLDRLEPIKTVYKLDRGCMEGTRIGLLDDIVDWAIRPHPDGNVSGTANSR